MILQQNINFRERDKEYKETHRQIDRETGRQTDEQTCIPSDKQKDMLRGVRKKKRMRPGEKNNEREKKGWERENSVIHN